MSAAAFGRGSFRLSTLVAALLAPVSMGGAGSAQAASDVRVTSAAGAAAYAHVWVDPDGGSCRRVRVPARYADRGACGDLGAAYRAAGAGDTVLVAAGTYGRQVIPPGDKRVTLRNAPGRRVVLGTVEVNASNVRMVGFRIRRTDDPGSAAATLEIRGERNVFDRVYVDTMKMPVRQGIHVDGTGTVLRNGSTYNVVDEKGALVGASGVTFDNFAFHDVSVTHSSVHNECVYSNGPNLTIRNSRFWNCATMDLFVTRGDWWGQPLYGGVTLVNNVFGHTTNTGPGSWHYYSLGINGGVLQEIRGWRVVNNTFETAVGGYAPAPGTIWANNLGSWNCLPGAVYSGNIGKACSGSDKAVSPAASCAPPACARPTTAAYRWVNPPKHDFHLRRGSPAIGVADPRYAPRRDKDGRVRRGRPDAGAYEYRG